MKRVKERPGTLKGGRASLLEGLGVSERSCAQPLSVAGFLVIIRRFPDRERLFSGREEEVSRETSPLFFNLSAKSVKLATSTNSETGDSTRRCAVRQSVYGRVYVPRDVQGWHIHQGGYTRVYREAYNQGGYTSVLGRDEAHRALLPS